MGMREITLLGVIFLFLWILSHFRQWRGTAWGEGILHWSAIYLLFFRGSPLGLGPLYFWILATFLIGGIALLPQRASRWATLLPVFVLFAARWLPHQEMGSIAVTLGSWAPPLLAQSGLMSFPSLPGLSYLVFRWIRFQLDARKHDLPVKMGPLFVYGGMVPWFYAGPISSYSEFATSYDLGWKRDWQVYATAVARLVWGATKFFALSSLVYQLTFTRWLAESSPISLPLFLFAAAAYPVYLFLNFSGFTDMMVSVAAILGYSSTENFDRPYLALSMRDFWRRWHISLTRLLIDFVYIPSQIRLEEWGVRSEGLRRFLGVFTVFALMAIWHGTSWNFAVFSGLQVLFLSVEWMLNRKRAQISVGGSWRNFVLRGYVAFALILSFFFFENSPDSIHQILERATFLN